METASMAALLLAFLAVASAVSERVIQTPEQSQLGPEHLSLPLKEHGYAGAPAPSVIQAFHKVYSDVFEDGPHFVEQTEVQPRLQEGPQFQQEEELPPEQFPESRREEPPAPQEAIPQQEQRMPMQVPMEQKEEEPSFPLQKEMSFPSSQHQAERPVPVMDEGRPQPETRGPSNYCPSNRPRGRWVYRLDGFPPGRPSPDNQEQICLSTRKVIVFGPWNLPQTGFSHLTRQGETLNLLETGYTRCCRCSNPMNRLDCLALVWENALAQFCEAEFSVKTRPHWCCQREEGEARLSCFEKEAPLPQYPSRACPSHQAGLSSGPELPFPPGLPTLDNVKNICRLRRFRALPRHFSTDDPVQQQLQALSQLEAEFQLCCRQGGNLTCFQKAWEDNLDEYCRRVQSVKTHQHSCCQFPPSPARDECFARRAPYPNYDHDILTVDLSYITPKLMNHFCGNQRVLSKYKQVPGLIQNITASCCQVPFPEQACCAEDEKSAFVEELCGPRKNSWRDPARCCDLDSKDKQMTCFNIYYLRNVAVVNGDLGQGEVSPSQGSDIQSSPEPSGE